MLNRYMWKRPGSTKWQLRKPVPTDVRSAFGRPVVTLSLGTDNEVIAAQRALDALHNLELQWSALRRTDAPPRQTIEEKVFQREPFEGEKQAIIREVYEQVLRQAEVRDIASFPTERAARDDALRRRRETLQDLAREVRAGRHERVAAPVARMLANRGFNNERDAAWFQQLVRNAATALLNALDVNLRGEEGEIDPRPQSDVVKRALASKDDTDRPADLPFSELVNNFMKAWIAGRKGSKETNTEPQKRATLRLFGDFFDDRSIRLVQEHHAAAFRDALRLFDPSWGRSPATRHLSWKKLVERYGARGHGLSDATMNRHMQVLQELWTWAKKRGQCSGENPFSGFHKKLRPGVNARPYVAWEDHELRQLLLPPPRRSDLLEVILVGLFTAMRLNEIASLTWGQIKQSDDDITYFQIEDAKTPAGIRKIPVHRNLKWLLSRDRGKPTDRLWPTFNEEGPGNKPGADAGREFSTFKAKRGFIDPTKTFHSFRKNVTRLMERAGIAENEWAQIFGHERGFTYRVYSPDGITMKQRAEIIALIDYPGIKLPHPSQ